MPAGRSLVAAFAQLLAASERLARWLRGRREERRLEGGGHLVLAALGGPPSPGDLHAWGPAEVAPKRERTDAKEYSNCPGFQSVIRVISPIIIEVIIQLRRIEISTIDLVLSIRLEEFQHQKLVRFFLIVFYFLSQFTFVLDVHCTCFPALVFLWS